MVNPDKPLNSLRVITLKEKMHQADRKQEAAILLNKQWSYELQ